MGEAMSSLVFQPPPPSRLKQSKLIWMTNSNGFRIPAFHIQTPDAKLTFLYSHANAEDLGNVYPWCKFLARMLKVNVFAYDYTGYGLSEGTPSQDNCFSDVYAAFRYIVDELCVEPSKVVLYGRSLGSGPSCYLAVRSAHEGTSVGGLILHAPFLSIFRIVMESGCTLIGDRFPNIDFAPHIKCPVLLIHGKKDNIVPFRHSEQLLQAVSEPCRTQPLFIKDMGHNHVHALFRPLFVERLSTFLRNHVLYANVYNDTMNLQPSFSGSLSSKSSLTSIHSKRNIPYAPECGDEDYEKRMIEKKRSQRISSKGFKKVFAKKKTAPYVQ